MPDSTGGLGLWRLSDHVPLTNRCGPGIGLFRQEDFRSQRSHLASSHREFLGKSRGQGGTFSLARPSM